MLSIFLFILIAWMLFGTLLTVGSVGKPREAITGTVAITTVLINGAFITVLVLSAISLSGV